MLVIRKPWPSMIRTIWGDPERFKKTYFIELGELYLAVMGLFETKNMVILQL